MAGKLENWQQRPCSSEQRTSYPADMFQAEPVRIHEWREEIEFQYDLLSLA